MLSGLNRLFAKLSSEAVRLFAKLSSLDPKWFLSPVGLTAVFAIFWSFLWLDWLSLYQLPGWVHWVGFSSALIPLFCWLEVANPGFMERPVLGSLTFLRISQVAFGDGPAIKLFNRNTNHREPLPPLLRYAVYTACIFPVWHLLTFFCYELGWMTLSAMCARIGLCVCFVAGLAWTTWWVEQKSREYQVTRAETSSGDLAIGPLHAMHQSLAGPDVGEKIWNPLDMDAWFYGKQRQKLRQSLSVLFSYLVLFTLLVMLILWIGGCKEIYEMPAGGGEQKQLQQIVKVQKIIKKKFIINPLSSVIFNPPPIEDIKLQLLEITKHAYKVGYGKGSGAGFSGGTNRGKVRFIRLEYSGGDWDQGMRSDLNMLVQYGIRTQHKVDKRPETRKVAQLKNFPVGKSPPVVYMTGQKSISFSKSEIEIVHEYLTEKHGMIFADNGGSRHWHNHFFSVMRNILPTVQPIRIPLDHPIHRVPYPIPFLPYVAPHGGKDAWGWVIDGRVAVYYHPGDIGDAWADDHAGVRTIIWEACYQLGTNVFFYAHAEYNKWLDSRKKSN